LHGDHVLRVLNDGAALPREIIGVAITIGFTRPNAGKRLRINIVPKVRNIRRN